MARPKGGLGKGLDSLFADLPPSADADNTAVLSLPLREIVPDPAQPRQNFDETALAELAQSIKENGLLQPVSVRPQKAGTGYILIAGERRWRAARMAGLTEIPALVRNVTEEQAAALSLIENLQREDLDPMEQAQGIKTLVETYGITQQTAAQRLGKSRSAIANSLRLLTLPEAVQQELRRGTLHVGHAKALLSLSDPEAIQTASQEVLNGNLTVRETEALCRKLSRAAKKNASNGAGGKKKQSDKEPDDFVRPVLAVETEVALREATGCEVHVAYRDGRGTLQIAFYSDEMLKKLAAALGNCHLQ